MPNDGRIDANEQGIKGKLTYIENYCHWWEVAKMWKMNKVEVYSIGGRSIRNSCKIKTQLWLKKIRIEVMTELTCTQKTALWY